MPGRDRTGPQGIGAMTGRGSGYCNGNRGAGYADSTPQPLSGWGIRGGRNCGGGGRGRRNMFYATGQPGWMRSDWDCSPTPEQESQALKNQAEALESELKLVNQRLAEFESTDKAE